MTDSCRRAGAQASIPVYCPTIIPDFGIYKESGFGPLTPNRKRRYYVSTFNNAGPFHWIVGAGTRRTLRRYPFATDGGRHKRPRLVKTTRIASGRLARLWRFPRERSNEHSGHVVAIVRHGEVRVFASMHGYRYGDLALAVADNMRVVTP